MKRERKEDLAAYADLANRLRAGAERIRQWENEAIREAQSTGKSARRYGDADLVEKLADAFDNPASPFLFRAVKNGRGRPWGGVRTFDRDFAVASA